MASVPTSPPQRGSGRQSEIAGGASTFRAAAGNSGESIPANRNTIRAARRSSILLPCLFNLSFFFLITCRDHLREDRDGDLPRAVAAQRQADGGVQVVAVQAVSIQAG